MALHADLHVAAVAQGVHRRLRIDYHGRGDGKALRTHVLVLLLNPGGVDRVRPDWCAAGVPTDGGLDLVHGELGGIDEEGEVFVEVGETVDDGSRSTLVVALLAVREAGQAGALTDHGAAHEVAGRAVFEGVGVLAREKPLHGQADGHRHVRRRCGHQGAGSQAVARVHLDERLAERSQRAFEVHRLLRIRAEAAQHRHVLDDPGAVDREVEVLDRQRAVVRQLNAAPAGIWEGNAVAVHRHLPQPDNGGGWSLAVVTEEAL